MFQETPIHDPVTDEIRESLVEEDSEVDESGVVDSREFLRRVGVFEDALALLDEIQKAA